MMVQRERCCAIAEKCEFVLIGRLWIWSAGSLKQRLIIVPREELAETVKRPVEQPARESERWQHRGFKGKPGRREKINLSRYVTGYII